MFSNNSCWSAEYKTWTSIPKSAWLECKICMALGTEWLCPLLPSFSKVWSSQRKFPLVPFHEFGIEFIWRRLGLASRSWGSSTLGAVGHLWARQLYLLTVFNFASLLGEIWIWITTWDGLNTTLVWGVLITFTQYVMTCGEASLEYCSCTLGIVQHHLGIKDYGIYIVNNLHHGSFLLSLSTKHNLTPPEDYTKNLLEHWNCYWRT